MIYLLTLKELFFLIKDYIDFLFKKILHLKLMEDLILLPNFLALKINNLFVIVFKNKDQIKDYC
jgi:hypothetical protein